MVCPDEYLPSCLPLIDAYQGPAFASYFESQNAAISTGHVTGNHLNLVALGINNGWFDPVLQYKAYVDYSYNVNSHIRSKAITNIADQSIQNTYKSLISDPDRQSYLATYQSSCVPALDQCAKSGSNIDCAGAETACYSDIEGPLSQVSDFDVYDIRQPSNDSYPPKQYATYLQRSTIQNAIGAKTTYQQCPTVPYQKFSVTGDNSRSTLPQLSSVVSSGNVTTLIWAGDADWICNWYGGLAAAEAVKYAEQAAFVGKPLQPYTVSGSEVGMYKTEGKLSWLTVSGAEHEVPYYQPKVALQVFEQTMKGQAISGT